MSLYRRPLNQIIFCEKPWLLPALLLLSLWVFTAAWAIYLVDLHFDDFEFEHYAIKGAPHTAVASGALPVGAGLQTVAATTTTDTMLRLQQQVAPAIAHLHTLNNDPAQGELPRVLASGVVIHPAGYLVTLAHPLQGLQAVRVDIKQQNGIARYRGDIIHRDPSHNLALIKLRPAQGQAKPRFLFLKIANSDSEPVYAFGLDTASQVIGRSGSINQRGVSLNIGNHALHQLWQSDAVYQWEQSGGPLVNSAAELVGINVALRDSFGRIKGYVIPDFAVVNAFGAEIALTYAQQLPFTRWQQNSAMQPAPLTVAATNLLPQTPIVTDTEHNSDFSIAGYSLTSILGLAALGLTAGVIGGMMAMGGGIVLVSGMFLFFGYGMYLIRPVAFITNLFTYGGAAWRNHQTGLIMFDTVKRLTPWAVLGVVLGYFIGNALGDGIIGYLLGGFALLMAAKVLHELLTDERDMPFKAAPQPEIRPPSDDDQLFAALDDGETVAVRSWSQRLNDGLVAVPMGLVSGILGISGGVIEVPLQRYFHAIPLRNAIANSSVMVFWTSLSASVVAMVHGVTVGAFVWTTPVGLALVMIPSSWLGGVLGARLLKHIPLERLKWLYVALMLAISLRLLII
ncbi:MAG: TSUP family transporter [Gammaproteobacteria bacterium]|nr:TSUP family transporter [Gammaproteobacteria bacterium]